MPHAHITENNGKLAMVMSQLEKEAPLEWALLVVTKAPGGPALLGKTVTGMLVAVLLTDISLVPVVAPQSNKN